jgi:hypothetical protein
MTNQIRSPNDEGITRCVFFGFRDSSLIRISGFGFRISARSGGPAFRTAIRRGAEIVAADGAEAFTATTARADDRAELKRREDGEEQGEEPVGNSYENVSSPILLKES